MFQDTNQGLPEITMEPNELYREEVYTDRKIGTIRIMIPVSADGKNDETRDTIYAGQTQIMTPAGALPISFDIDAQSIGDAASKFGDAAQKGIEQTMKELEELRREQASSIVLPGAGGGMGGGKIQMP